MVKVGSQMSCWQSFSELLVTVCATCRRRAPLFLRESPCLLNIAHACCCLRVCQAATCTSHLVDKASYWHLQTIIYILSSGIVKAKLAASAAWLPMATTFWQGRLVFSPLVATSAESCGPSSTRCNCLLDLMPFLADSLTSSHEGLCIQHFELWIGNITLRFASEHVADMATEIQHAMFSRL